MGSLTLGSVLIGSFIACSVEVTEMVIIVVGVGTTREWRSTLIGAGCGLLVLVALIAGLGQALSLVPIGPLRVAIGGLLLTFGLQWLSKGVVQVAADGFSGGEEDEGVGSGPDRVGALDWTAWLLSFKGVTLEGLEVAFIVIAFGAGSRGGQGGYLDAFVGAAAAFVVVGSIGLLALNRLKKVPGRSLKFAVGGLISTFGTFWAMEGLGVHWPGGRLSLAWLYAAYLGLTVTLMLMARHGVIGPSPLPSVLGDTGPQGPLGVAPASAGSVRLYQRKHDLSPTGEIDRETRAAMRSEMAEAGVDGMDPVVLGVDPTDGSEVGRLQARFGLAVTGDVDAETRGVLRVLQHPGLFEPDDAVAVRRFQQQHRLTVTGRYDQLTKAAARSVALEAHKSPSDDGRDDPFGAALHVDVLDADSVRRLQRSFHLAEDGVIGPETRGAIKALRRVLGAVTDGDSEPALPSSPGVVDPADENAVADLQRSYHIAPDGAVGQDTRQALRWESQHLLGVDVSSAESVKAFQRSHGLAEDGVVGPVTQAAMRAARVARAGDGGRDDRFGPAAGHAAGFGVGLDPADAGSVRSFQEDHGLAPDGVIGPLTRAALRALKATASGAKERS